MSSSGVEVADAREDPRGQAVDLRRVEAAAAAVLEAEGRGAERVSLALVDDERMAELHLRYLDRPGPTDVLSFPLDDGLAGPEPLLGEVVVSVDTAAREAEERGLELEEELLRYVVHGLLHLLGYDDADPEERARMEARQEELLARFLPG